MKQTLLYFITLFALQICFAQNISLPFRSERTLLTRSEDVIRLTIKEVPISVNLFVKEPGGNDENSEQLKDTLISGNKKSGTLMLNIFFNGIRRDSTLKLVLLKKSGDLYDRSDTLVFKNQFGQLEVENPKSIDNFTFVDATMLSSGKPIDFRKEIPPINESKSIKYRYIYDYLTGNTYLLKRGTDLSYKKRFSPSVGTEFKVEVINYNKNEDLKIKYAFDDDNTEYDANFLKLFDSSPKPTAKIDSATKASSSSASDSVNKVKLIDTLQLLNNLNAQLKDYIENYIVNSSNIYDHIENVNTIKSRIVDAFQIENPSSDMVGDLEKKINKSNSKQVEAFNLFKTFYDILLKKKPIIFAPARIKNVDNYRFDIINKTSSDTLLSRSYKTSFGIKVDVSTGVFMTKLQDFDYIFKTENTTYRTDPAVASTQRDTSGRVVVRQKAKNYDLGFGLISHVYPRIGDYVNLSFSTGLILKTDANINLLAGLSLLLGRERRFIATFGYAWGKVKRLSSEIDENLNRIGNAEYGKPRFYPSSEYSNIPYAENITEKAFFFGFSYNLGTVK